MKSGDASSVTNNEASSKKIVCIYTQNDESFYHELQTYLSLWQRERYIQWLETPAGSDVEHTMQAYLQQADLILLLISPNFFAQDHCYNAMQISLQEQTLRQVPVVPVLARASFWKESKCGSLRALPGDERPIADVMHRVFRVGYINEIPENSDVVYSVGDAVTVTYLFWLINGGFATIQHLMLRIRLWKTRCAPWRYPRFLEYAQERILLRRVGGGYIFVHKLLLEYFASLDMIEGAYGLTEESKQPEVVSPAAEMPGDVQKEDAEKPTAQLILVPVVSEIPLLLPCGHEQYNPNARFCSVCGRPVFAEPLDQ